MCKLSMRNKATFSEPESSVCETATDTTSSAASAGTSSVCETATDTTSSAASASTNSVCGTATDTELQQREQRLHQLGIRKRFIRSLSGVDWCSLSWWSRRGLLEVYEGTFNCIYRYWQQWCPMHLIFQLKYPGFELVVFHCSCCFPFLRGSCSLSAGWRLVGVCPLVDGSLCKAKLALQNALFSISSAER